MFRNDRTRSKKNLRGGGGGKGGKGPETHFLSLDEGEKGETKKRNGDGSVRLHFGGGRVSGRSKERGGKRN